MPSSDLFEEKVQSYLATLTPEARRMLARRLASGETTAAAVAASVGAVTPRGDAIEVPVRSGSGAAGYAPAAPAIRRRVPVVPFDAREEVFAPFRPFVVADRTTERQRGWIRPETLDGLWLWLVREGIPDAAAPWSGVRELTEEAAADARMKAIPRLADQAFDVLSRTDRAGHADGRLQQRFVSRIGGEAALADLRDLIAIRPHLGHVEPLLQKVPALVQPGEGAEKGVAAALAEPVRADPSRAVWLAAALAGRFANPGSLVRVACQLSGAQDVAQLRRSPFAPLADVALSCADRHAVRFVAALSDPGRTAEALAELRAFHEALRLSTMAINLADDRAWHRRLAALKRHVSEPLGEAVGAVVPAMRVALGGDRWRRPGEADRVEALRAASLLAAARRFRDSLAVNAVVERLWPVADQGLQTWGRAALDRLRTAAGREREELLLATATFVEIGGEIHGPDYAALQRRARDKAIAG